MTEQHTKEPWWFEENEMFWQLFGGGGTTTTELPDGTRWDIAGHPIQILKAPKKDTPYAEYWPNPADGHRMVAAVNTCAGVPTDQLKEGFLRKVLDLNTQQAVRMTHLAVLAVGCRAHPSYRAIKPPTTKRPCDCCRKVWEASQALKEMASKPPLRATLSHSKEDPE